MPRSRPATPGVGWAALRPRQYMAARWAVSVRQNMGAEQGLTVSRTRSMACLGRGKYLPARSSSPHQHSLGEESSLLDRLRSKVVYSAATKPRCGLDGSPKRLYLAGKFALACGRCLALSISGGASSTQHKSPRRLRVGGAFFLSLRSPAPDRARLLGVLRLPGRRPLA